MSAREFPVSSEVISIRRASEDERWRASLLFQMRLIPAAHYQVAVKGRFNRIVGLWGLQSPNNIGDKSVFHWRLAPRYVGSQLERKLVCLAIDQASTQGAGILETSEMLEASGAADRLLDSLGFHIVLTDDLYEIDLAKGKMRVDRLQKMLPRRHAAPPGAEVVPLFDDGWPVAAELAFAHGLLDQSYLNSSLSETPFARGSVILLVDGKVRGAILGTVHGRVAEVAAMVVDLEFRAGAHWANAFLCHIFGRWMTSLGVETLRFRAHPAWCREIRNFARRCGGRVLIRQHARALALSHHEPVTSA